MSTLKNAKESLEKSERRALDEVRDLTERVHRLQVYFFSHCHIYKFYWIGCHFTSISSYLADIVEVRYMQIIFL